MRRIASRQNPVVARYRAAARGEADDIMLLDGAHLVDEALTAGIVLDEAAVAGEGLDGAESRAIVTRLERAGVATVSATAPVMAALSPVRSPSRIVALARRPRIAVEHVFARKPPLVVLAVNIQDPGNLGAIVRVAEAAGAGGVLVAARSADPFGWKALRGSMGSTLRLPVVRVPDIARALATAREHRCQIVATAPRGGRSVFEMDLRGPVAILVGGEGAGLPDEIVDLADERVSIPMQDPVESLNAAVTAAVIMYEARRQRALG
jgi:RNA methyltransferase, TrmH family